MKARILAVGVLAIVCSLMTGFKPQGRVYGIDIRVFQILPIQTVTSAGPDKNGNIVGTTTGGDVTAGFPSHPVVFQTDLTLKAGEEEIKGILYDRKLLPRSSELSSGVHWTFAEHYSISCSQREWGTDASRHEYHEPEIIRSPTNRTGRAEYWLTISPISSAEQEATLRLKYAGFGKVLFDQEVKVTLDKIAIVGFPQYGDEEKRPEPRGTVCILILHVQ